MTFDEQHGWVERGTAGHRASAEVADVAAEVAALDRTKARPVMALGWATRQLPFGVTPGEMLRYKRAYGVHATGAVPRPPQQTDLIIARARIRHGRRHGRVAETYRVDGDTLHIVQPVTIPTRAQTVTVNATIGGE